MDKRIVKYLDKKINADVENKTIVITGGNSGIGFMSARIALYLKMNVILACRNKEKAEKAIKQLKEEFPNSNIRLMIVDMSEEQSIINFVNKIKEEHIDIDVFYHNAGVYRLPYELKEGKELVASTNYFGPYILSSLLLPYLHSLNHEVKMIFTSSVAANLASNKIEMLAPSPKVSRMKRYSNSKLLDAYLFKYLFDNDHQNIEYYLVHPGVTVTGLFDKSYKNKLFVKVSKGFIKLSGNPIWKSALSFTKVLDVNNKPGEFYGPTHMLNWRGYPKVNRFLNKKYKLTDNIISKTEEITGYALLKK